MMPGSEPGTIHFRQAQISDAEFIWMVRNDPRNLMYYFHPEPVSFPDHLRWFLSKLDDPAARFFIIVEGTRDIGVVRLDIRDTDAEVSITLAASEQRRGLGARALRVLEAMTQVLPIRRLVARIRPHNEASLRAFSRAEFAVVGNETVNDLPAIVMEWRRQCHSHRISPPTENR